MKLLVAVDGSEEANEALAYATDIADATNGSVTVAYAVDPAIYDRGGTGPISSLSDAEQRLVIENIEDTENRGLEVLDDATDFAADLGQEVETELLYGTPVVAITDFAEEEGFDTIVVGHRGRSERTERLLGSVAKGIVERTTVTVTVVR
ncbi:universal stress protein [Haloplanus litoreus]|uniref:Universal stress protein n=1 Tax=Haloplanus litoreus TaxID=767515 RepID=A0ABD5ZYT1_9EURY